MEYTEVALIREEQGMNHLLKEHEVLASVLISIGFQGLSIYLPLYLTYETIIIEFWVSI
ncbi:hypothetical protein [Pseudoalteromonas aurantia]|uniref:hypothetical protein n=1 Tax=Pseudoalteromonas aurantia TaxID=43654 RepID=UPI00148666D0|nr:hypothetical protein [Pseudoalteromonas aurantia]